MKRRIFKYKLQSVVEQIIELPINSKVLCVRYDEEARNIFVWILVDMAESEMIIPMKFFIAGTGWDIEEILSKYDLFYLGSVKEDPYVWHIFSECSLAVEI